MNGTEHYKEAERLLASQERFYNGGQTRAEIPPSPEKIAKAQVHATLALTAATAGHKSTWTDTKSDTTSTYVEGDWAEVLG